MGRRVSVVDADLNPVPPMVRGELVLGGAGVALGYWGNARLTAERFLPDPEGQNGARVYRTGDLARLASGSVEVLGRLDNEVKVRSARVDLDALRSILLEHPEVSDGAFAVVPFRDAEHSEALIAAVVPRQLAPARITEKAVVDTWRDVYNATLAVEGFDPEFNYSGWINSYDGSLYSHEEMTEWLDAIIGRVSPLLHGRVLEIGVGTGLLLFRVLGAPAKIASFLGLDVSLDTLVELKKALPSERSDVSLMCCDALGTEALHASFDCTLINSVTQHFPNLDYLDRVVRAAIARTAPGGHVWVGDVRNYDQLMEYHTAAACASARDDTTATALLGRAERELSLESELVVAPHYFFGLASHPRVSGVRVMPKVGFHEHELNAFRYDVVVEVEGTARPSRLEVESMRFGDVRPEDVCSLVAERQAPLVLTDVKGWAGSRWTDVVQALRTVARDGGLLDDVPSVGSRCSLAMLAEALAPSGWRCEPSMRPLESSGCAVDVLLSRDVDRIRVGWARSPGFQSDRPLANDPTEALNKARAFAQLEGDIATWLRQRIPRHSLPQAVVVVDAVPRGRSGKVDVGAVAAYGTSITNERSGEDGDEGPLDATEERIAEVFARVLGRPKVGRAADFFSLGGHSLMAAEVVRELGRAGLTTSLRDFFADPTIRGVARAQTRAAPQAVSTASPERTRSARARDGGSPVTAGQQWELTMERMLPAGTLNMELVCCVADEASDRAIRGAVAMLAEMHPALRMSIQRRAGQFRQRPADRPLDVEFVAGPATEESVGAYVRRRLDIAGGEAARAVFFRDDRVLLLAIHHAVADAWSLRLIHRDLDRLFEAHCSGSAMGEGTPAPGSSLLEYAEEEAAGLSGDRLRELDEEAAQLFGGAVGILVEPTTDETFAGARSARAHASISVPTDHGSTFMLTFAGLAIGVGRLTGQPNLTVATIAANRDDPKYHDVVGCLANTVLCRARTGPHPVVMADVRRATGRALASGMYPFPRLLQQVPELRSRRQGLTAVIQTMEIPVSAPTSGMLRSWGPWRDAFGSERRSADLADFHFVASRRRGGLGVSCLYDPGSVGAHTVQHLIDALSDGVTRFG
jgi:SAM-dependent methyltransferase